MARIQTATSLWPCEGVAPSPAASASSRPWADSGALRRSISRVRRSADLTAHGRGKPDHRVPIQPAARLVPSVAAVPPSGCLELQSGPCGWRRTGSNFHGPRLVPASSRCAGIMCSCSSSTWAAIRGSLMTQIPATSDPAASPFDRWLRDRQSSWCRIKKTKEAANCGGLFCQIR